MTTETMPIKSTTSDNKIKTVMKDFIVHIIGQLRISKKIYPGIMHFLIFWGVTIQVIGTAINLMQMKLFTPFELTVPRSYAYLGYELIMDMAGVAILIGIGMAALRRFLFKPNYLETRKDDVFALVLLALIPIVGFTNESIRLYLTNPEWANWSPIGNYYANLWRNINLSPEFAANAHPYIFWAHAALGLTLVASIPFTKMRHLLFAPINILLRDRRKEGVLSKIENIDEAEILGVGQVTEFAPQQLLSFEACVNCGRCEDVCPCTISGMPYSPRTLIQSLRQKMVTGLIPKNGKTNTDVFSSDVTQETPWYCTTCGACLKRCPALINPIDQVIDLRRYQVLTTGDMQKSVGDVLRNVERQGNPWGMPAEDRTSWADGLGVRELSPGDETDVLLYLGCAFAYDDRNKKVAQSFVKILQKAGIDFATLGIDEACCGETARRMGNEYLFQVMAEQNIETLSKVKFNRVVTQCPHCFNTLKNEYPQIGGVYKVQHYTEYLAELDFPWKDISPNGHGIKGKTAFHDSCYLGRYNDIYHQPREILRKAKVSNTELPRSGENSFCCGGGGGQMWMETDAETRINHRRLQDALDVNCEVVATACPYCLLMFDDAIRSKGIGDKIEVLDIAEVIERQIS